MSAIAFDIPEDIRAMRDGLRAFAEAEVLPRHEANRDLIGDDPGALEVDMVLVIPRRSELEP